MFPPLTKSLSLSLLVLVSTAPTPMTATPAPATQTNFSLPLSDGSTATARLLPTTNGEAWLVYATSSGQLAAYYLTPHQPVPPPTPPTPDPPTPLPPPPDPQPQPTRLTIAVIENPETTTNAQRAVLTNTTWSTAATAKHTFLGIVPDDVIDKTTGLPPPRLAPFLARAKLHNLPWILFADPNGVIVWEGTVPTTATELTALIAKYGG